MLVLLLKPGADPGEEKWVNFHPPFFLSPFFLFFSYPSNIEIMFDFSDIITKIHPPFQNPGSAFGSVGMTRIVRSLSVFYESFSKCTFSFSYVLFLISFAFYNINQVRRFALHSLLRRQNPP